ncbi:unnamed protein product, partial [Rodentolepis nana]|uniref:Ribonuclease H protein n=1 Tax=Rodentolepis nana TaxID=102285 RepID=A0A0R3TGJ0_RODNA
YLWLSVLPLLASQYLWLSVVVVRAGHRIRWVFSISNVGYIEGMWVECIRLDTESGGSSVVPLLASQYLWLSVVVVRAGHRIRWVFSISNVGYIEGMWVESLNLLKIFWQKGFILLVGIEPRKAVSYFGVGGKKFAV